MTFKSGAVDLFVAPRALLDARVELVMPALAALLSKSTGEVLGDGRPLRRPGRIIKSDFCHERANLLIFLRCPRAFVDLRIQNFAPAMQALYRSLVREDIGDGLPVATTALGNLVAEQLVLCLAPSGPLSRPAYTRGGAIGAETPGAGASSARTPGAAPPGGGRRGRGVVAWGGACRPAS